MGGESVECEGKWRGSVSGERERVSEWGERVSGERARVDVCVCGGRDTEWRERQWRKSESAGRG